MPDAASLVIKQLREACKCSGAHWAVWIERKDGDYQPVPSEMLSKTRQKALAEFFRVPQNAAWLGGAINSGHTRSRTAGGMAQRLGCAQIFAFPNQNDQSVLLVGSDSLGKEQRDLFRVMAIGGRLESEATSAATTDQLVFRSFNEGLETSYDPEKVLDHVLTTTLELVPAEAAYLAIRSGDIFRVHIARGCPEDVIGLDISLPADAMLNKIIETYQGVIAPLDGSQPEVTTICNGSAIRLVEAMEVPIILGRRVIGVVVLLASTENRFTPDQMAQLTQHLSRMSHAIENAMIFAEAVRYLQQFALLNDLALAASGGLGTDEVARRVLERLQRSFSTQDVAVLLLSTDGSQLLEYGVNRNGAGRLMIPVSESLAGYVIENLTPVRLGDLKQAPRYFAHGRHTESALFVPLKYRGMPIGVIGLESEKPNAFTQQDEQLMLVIASHLAGLFENARLHQEARERAGKLGLIHEVIQRVLGLRDEASIAQEAADLIASYFKYEIAAVLVADETGQYLVNLGIGGSMAHLAMPGTQYSIQEGITGRVFNTGLSCMANDLVAENGYSPTPGWRAGSVLCVPLRERERLFGLINVERSDANAFTESDLLMLESLAGILSSVLINARRYRELKQRIEAQQLAENRLVRSARLAAVGEMAAGVAHELNNPLTTVMGFLELVLEDTPPATQQHDDLDLALREAQRAREVVRRLLDFSRQTSNIFIRTDLNELVQEVLPLVHHQMQTAGVEIEYTPAESLPGVSVNPNQIKQVILNLLQNALQAMPNGGTMTVKTGRENRSDGQGVYIKVCDMGEGIPPENYERIFEPFFTTRPVGQGTGLGLSVSYGIITSHGGLIDVDSVLGRGSCFTVWLPCERMD